MSLNRCPRKGTPHDAHPMRLYFAGMGAVVPTTCPGEPAQPVAEDRAFYDGLHDSIPSDIPDTPWESDAASRGAGE